MGWLLILGGLVMGVEGLAGMNLLDTMLGPGSVLVRLVQLAVGVSAVMMAYKMSTGKKR